MINFLKKYFILIILAILVIILIIVNIVFGGKKEEETIGIVQQQTTPTSTISKTNHENDVPSLEKDETTVLPYMGKKMQVSGYKTPGVMEIFINKEEDKEAAEIEFKEWQKQYPFFKIDSVVYTVRKIN